MAEPAQDEDIQLPDVPTDKIKGTSEMQNCSHDITPKRFGREQNSVCVLRKERKVVSPDTTHTHNSPQTCAKLCSLFILSVTSHSPSFSPILFGICLQTKSEVDKEKLCQRRSLLGQHLCVK